jgi:hypothetical protein
MVAKSRSYYKPEETYRKKSSEFAPNEVFDSTNFFEHPLKTVIRKVTIVPWDKYDASLGNGMKYFILI